MTSLAGTVARLKSGGVERREEYLQLRTYISREYPYTMKALRLVDAEWTEGRRKKGYSLVKRENAKLGYVYYVRYWHEGRMLPSKWNCHTNELEAAERYAAGNRERLIEGYLGKHGPGEFKLFEKFYEEGSEYMAEDEKRSAPLSGKTRRGYEGVIKNKFLPYLEERKIRRYEGIDIGVLEGFQDRLLAGGAKPQTVNDSVKAVRRIYKYLERKKLIKENPAARLGLLPVRAGDQRERGCYEAGRLKRVFNVKWRDERSYYLCLLIYTTGMRNGEIQRLRVGDIKKMGGCYFIDIKESKTANGVRLVPLHEFVYRKLLGLWRERPEGGLLFEGCGREAFKGANEELARRLKAEEEIAEQNITYYSGRHYWKTLMNSEGLGEDIEEIFMGHKVSEDVAKRYNHRDKQGLEQMVKKARRVYTILDKRLFCAAG